MLVCSRALSYGMPYIRVDKVGIIVLGIKAQVIFQPVLHAVFLMQCVCWNSPVLRGVCTGTVLVHWSWLEMSRVPWQLPTAIFNAWIGVSSPEWSTVRMSAMSSPSYVLRVAGRAQGPGRQVLLVLLGQ